MSDIDVYKDWLGIPEGERPPDNYTLLRLVMFEDDTEKIRNNYRKLNAHVRKYATGQYLVRSQELLNELAKAMLCLTDPDGKLEYDESLGRPRSQEDDEEPKTTLQYLANKGLIKRAQISEIEHFAEARGNSHRDAVVQMKHVQPEEAARGLAAELRLPYIDLEDMLPEDNVLDQVPRRTVKKFACLPLFEDRGRLMVACSDEPSMALEDEIRIRFGMPMRAVLAVPRSINQAIAKYYAPGQREEPGNGNAVGSESMATKSTPKPKAQKQRQKAKAEPLSKEESAQRMQYSLIMICWSVIGTVGISYLLVEQLGAMHYGLAFVVGAIITGLLKLTYWK